MCIVSSRYYLVGSEQVPSRVGSSYLAGSKNVPSR